MLRHERQTLLRAHDRAGVGRDVERASALGGGADSDADADAHGVAARAREREREDAGAEERSRRCDVARSFRYGVRALALVGVLALAIGAAAGAWWGGRAGDARAGAATGETAGLDRVTGRPGVAPRLDETNGDFVGARGKRREAVGLGRSARGGTGAPSGA